MTPPSAGRKLREAELREILAALRDGASVTTAGSRCHSSYGFADGQWYREDFDEGALTAATVDEAQVRRALASEPMMGLGLLRQRRWQVVQAAVAADDRFAAIAALEPWRAYGGDSDTALIAAAWLRADTAPLDAASAAALRRRFEDGTLYHVFMNLHAWPRDAQASTRCLAFVDALLARLPGGAEDRTRLRARLGAPVAPDH
ncbi:MAG: hypothetical protein KDJ14_03170 [Xanthomonadales bacterium]|nr:hypothetical protein [Xanthomonadales bacterium]